jgi:hypothetical protein
MEIRLPFNLPNQISFKGSKEMGSRTNLSEEVETNLKGNFIFIAKYKNLNYSLLIIIILNDR